MQVQRFYEQFPISHFLGQLRSESKLFYEIFAIVKMKTWNILLCHDLGFVICSVYTACVRVLTKACLEKKRWCSLPVSRNFQAVHQQLTKICHNLVWWGSNRNLIDVQFAGSAMHAIFVLRSWPIRSSCHILTHLDRAPPKNAVDVEYLVPGTFFNQTAWVNLSTQMHWAHARSMKWNFRQTLDGLTDG